MRNLPGALKILFASCITVVSFNYWAFASSGGNSTSDLLNFSADPDSIALGNSILSLNSSPSGIVTNPAVLARTFQPKFSFTNTIIAGDVRYNFAGVSVPLKFGAIGVGASLIDYGQIQGYDANALPYDIPRSGETMVIFNYSMPLRATIPVLREYGTLGVNFKFLHGSLAGYNSDVTAMDIGGTCNLPFLIEGLSSGLVVRNIGESPVYENKSSKLPTSTNVSLRYGEPTWGNLFAVADAGADQDNTYYSIGAGISPMYPLTLRCGYRTADKSAASGVCLGFGININNFSLRYAMSPMTDLGAVHTVGVEITFASFTNPQVAYDQYLSRYFELARDKYNSRNYIEARQMFEDILSVYPGHLPSKEYLLKLNAQLDSMEQHQQVQVDRWLRKASTAFDRNDVIKARKYYSLVLNIDSGNAQALEGMSKIKSKLGEYENAEDEQLNKERIIGLWNTAVAYYAKGDYVAARQKFQEILRVDPNNEEAAKYINDIFNQLNKISSQQTDELFNKGMELFNQEKYAEAKKYFNAVVITDPERKEAREYANNCQQKLDEEQNKAASTAENVATKNVKIKGEIESSYSAALKVYKRGDYEEAVRLFTKLRESAQRYDYNKYAESARHYIVASKSALAEDYFKQGNNDVNSNRLESAVDCYKRALDYNPEFTAAKTELDRINDLLSQKYYEDGMKAFSGDNTVKAKELFKKSLEYKSDKIESMRALERIK